MNESDGIMAGHVWALLALMRTRKVMNEYQE